MKKKVVLFVAIILVVTLFSCVLIGCNKDNENSISTPKDFWDKYLIYYYNQYINDHKQSLSSLLIPPKSYFVGTP